KRKTINLLKESNLDKEVIKKLTPQDPIVSKFYGLPKIHKENVPLRPIVSTIGSTNYKLAKYLNDLLKPLIGKTTSYVKNSQDFVTKIQNLKINDNDLLVSLDVESLFTKVPLNETLTLLANHFDVKTRNLFEYCLNSCFFIFNGEF